jgi:hypothetical protein
LRCPVTEIHANKITPTRAEIINLLLADSGLTTGNSYPLDLHLINGTDA